MEKLELKHLAGYLPYGLKILYHNGNAKPYIEELVSLNTKLSGRILGSEKHKPILRPLSDLTKEIEVNGEKFVPIEKLKLLYNFEKRGNFELSMYIEDAWIRSCNDLPFDAINLLLEWHFDIYGLIPELAIDINTLNK